MSHIVPLVRAGAMVPMVRWMLANGRPAMERLRDADLAYLPLHDPDRPIPLLNVVAFFREAGRQEGPDIGCRVVSATSLIDIATIGKVALGARSPREALARVAAALPHHCTHEHFTIERRPDGLLLREGWSISFDDETLHLTQQFIASLVRLLCSMTGANDPLLARIEMVPHPVAGLEHLRPWFRAPVVPSASRALGIVIDASVADRPFRKVARDRTGGRLPPDWQALRGDGSLSASVRVVVAAMLEVGTPTVERLALSAGLSQRTLQRRLAEEGTSVSAVLEAVRRQEALRRLTGSRGSLGDLAAAMGYTRQSTLTRAVRRWTGNAPSRMNTGRAT